MARLQSLLLLSGPIGVGKTALADALISRYRAIAISTSRLMASSAGRDLDRKGLQTIGRQQRFQGADWIIAALLPALSNTETEIVIVDAIRTSDQLTELAALRNASRRMLHVHLTGDDTVLAHRYGERARSGDSGTSWEQAAQTPSERAVRALADVAHVVIDVTQVTVDDVACRVGAHLETDTHTPCVDVIVGGQWGSEGKGNIAFFLAPEYDLLVRVGSPNAGHKVYDYDGNIYTHRQLPSGTRATKAPLLIGPGAVIDVQTLLKEIGECGITAERLTIDANALIIGKHDGQSEAALKQAIGSTGTGTGAVMARRIVGRGQPDAVTVAKDVPQLQPFIGDALEVLDRAYRRHASVLLEGTQGTGLSILHGSYPHVTSRDTTVGTLIAEAGVAPCRLRHVVTAFRTYPIRVGGASGPMGREIDWATIAERSGLPLDEVQSTEVGSVSGNRRRVAEFSWTQLRRSSRLNGSTDIALTFLDYLDARNRSARRYDQLTDATIRFVQEVEAVAGVRVSLLSVGFDANGPIDRRQW